MKNSKLLLIHIIALNRCIMNDYCMCTSGYCRDNRDDEEVDVHCKAMGFIRADACPIVKYVDMYDYFNEELLKFLLDWS